MTQTAARLPGVQSILHSFLAVGPRASCFTSLNSCLVVSWSHQYLTLKVAGGLCELIYREQSEQCLAHDQCSSQG